MSKSKGKTNIVNLNGKPAEAKKPEIMLGRPIAREPMRENQLVFQDAYFTLAGRGYTMNYPDLIGMGWWLKHHSSNRNAICEEFLRRKNCDYLVCIDDDMTFLNLADDIEQAIALDKDMVMGITSCKPVPHFPNLGKFIKIGESGTIVDADSRNIYEFPNDKPFEVDFGSFGFIVIKRKVVATMEPPWCFFPPNYQTRNVWGEDVTFCYNAKMLGFELWCDPTIACGHLGYTAWHHERPASHWLDFKDEHIKMAKEQGWDCSHNLVPEVQAVFKEGKGAKRLV
jgi:hypothetical protein